MLLRVKNVRAAFDNLKGALAGREDRSGGPKGDQGFPNDLTVYREKDKPNKNSQTDLQGSPNDLQRFHKRCECEGKLKAERLNRSRRPRK